MQQKHSLALHPENTFALITMSMNNKMKARRIVARHTQHGLNKVLAKSLKVITSLGTERNYAQAISTYFNWCNFNAVHPDRHSNIRVLSIFLEERSEYVTQKTLDQERQALQLIYRQKLPYIHSQKKSILEKRSYTLSQVNSIMSHQTDKNSLTTQLAFYAGLRAHESATIRLLIERSPSNHRTWSSELFLGFPEHRLYTVVGKGGLIRMVAVPLWLSNKLEARRRTPIKVKDRGIFYESHYDIGYGQAWSQSFSSASKVALAYSTGAHGLRHSFSKQRLHQLILALEAQNLDTTKQNINEKALLILSQELGHFRLDIVFCYLR